MENELTIGAGDDSQGFDFSGSEPGAEVVIFDSGQGDGTVQNKRRKTEDGFVQPATPDIPKTSIRYQGENATQPEFVELAEPEYGTEAYESLETNDEVADGDQDNQQDEIISIPDDENPLNINAPITDVLQDEVLQLKTGCLKWASVFHESEEFELLCPRRLDALLTEARALRDRLMAKRQALRQRLQALSNVLKQ